MKLSSIAADQCPRISASYLTESIVEKYFSIVQDCGNALTDIYSKYDIDPKTDYNNYYMMYKVLNYFEKAFICYLQKFPQKTKLTDKETAVISMMLDSEYKLLLAYTPTEDNVVVCKILDTVEGKEKLRIFDTFMQTIKNITLTTEINNKISYLRKLIQCTNAAAIDTNNVKFEELTNSGYAVYSTEEIKQGDVYSAQIQQTARRNLDSKDMKCQATILKVPNTLKGLYDVIFEVEYRQDCGLPQGENCQIKPKMITLKD
mmetsp:Transcript_25387/g.29243  ORF Transcript_25387/g.29243 Transcript_25387/m.29243 type:complete len:260 (-) Transcript_25387:1319-2098(-)